ncbi:MAG TPA: phosphoribosyltransferase family protein, partial [archaeon]|nr:phosphoribosyltransferase family protein [archaeon]
FVTVSSHFQREQGQLKRFRLDSFNVDGFTALKDVFQERQDNWFFLAPDIGGVPLAKQLGKDFGVEFGYLEKIRNKETGFIEIKQKALNVITGKNVVIVDDMVSTGGTLVHAVNHAKKFNPASISLAFVHGVFAPGSLDKLKALDVALYYTDTVKDNGANVSVAEKIAKTLSKD